MNILVIGANGRTGRRVVSQAIDKGHKVTAFVRGRDPADAITDSVSIFQGDATKYSDIRKVVSKHDVVISTIGHTRRSPPNLQTTAIANITKAIVASNKNIKLVSLTGTGVRVRGDKISFLDYILNLSIKLIDPARVNDGIEHYQKLYGSKITWVVVRVLKLTNSNRAVRYRLSASGPAKTFISRVDVADALLVVAENSKWDNKAPILSRK